MKEDLYGYGASSGGGFGDGTTSGTTGALLPEGSESVFDDKQLGHDEVPELSQDDIETAMVDDLRKHRRNL